MKIRILKRLVNGVFEVLVRTEDWSSNDVLLMKRHGEPEINLGCVIPLEDSSSNSFTDYSSSSSSSTAELVIDDDYVRIMTESPYIHRFDSRDLGGVAKAKETGNKWCAIIEDRIVEAVKGLRENDKFFNTESIMEY